MVYYEICKFGLNIVLDNFVKVFYGYKGIIWVGFDDEYSLYFKVKEVIMKNGFMGVMFCVFDLDDFSGS